MSRGIEVRECDGCHKRKPCMYWTVASGMPRNGWFCAACAVHQ